MAEQKSRVLRGRGFTLIELMVTIAVLGILLSIAVNVYQEYTIRTRIAESVALVAPVQQAVSEYYSFNGTLPLTLGELEFITSSAAAYRGDYVSTIDLTAPGLVEVTMQVSDALGTASGTTVEFQAAADTGAVVNWTVGGSIPDKYRPR